MDEFIKKLIERLKEEKNKRLLFEDNATEEEAVWYFSGSRNGLADAIEIINELAEEYINCSTDTSTDCSTNNGWIACSEGVPEETECYLVTWKDRVTCKNYVEIIEYDAGSQEWLGCICQAGLLGYDIIAWQPLPPAFRQDLDKSRQDIISETWKQQTMSRFERVE